MEKSKPLATILAGAFLAVSTPAQASEPEQQSESINILAPQPESYRLCPEGECRAESKPIDTEENMFEANDGRLTFKLVESGHKTWSLFAGRGESQGREILKMAGMEEIHRRGRGVGGGVSFSLEF